MTAPSNMMAGLEMEEVEGLVNVSSSNVGSGAKRRSKASLMDKCAAVAVESQNRKRFITVSLVALCLLLVWIAASGGDGSDVPHLVDVEGKDTDSNGSSVDTSTDATTDATKPAEPKETEAPKETPPPAPPTPPPTPEPIKTDLRIPQLEYEDPFHVPITPEYRDYITNRWGQWHFWDGDEAQRPKEDYCGQHPNRDIPGAEFPGSAWQVDAVYVNHFLNDADKLVTRTMEAIFTEYGHGKPLPAEEMMKRMKMFHWEMLDMETATGPPANFARRGNRDTGGWTTKRSYQGLVRRLLHAMMTRDTFTVVLGGHSAAAGAGNHFRQSYMMQFHKIMFPVFARLGVKLITRNISQGGLGTIQAAMGSGDIYGDEVDLLIWDSGMTEGPAPHHVDLFLRQGLLGGNRVPVLWGGLFPLLKMLHEECDADVGENGLGTFGIPITQSEEQALEIPFAARNFKCSEERADLCSERFRATCWIDRPDGIKPEAKQYEHLKSQVKWHPGWRPHQLEGRVIAFQILEALQSAINTWSEATMSGQPLDDSYWHVTEYYENIRTKVKNLDKSKGNCYDIEGTLPTRMCNTPMKGRTQYTPRANFDQTSLTSILKPAADGYIPKNTKVALYEGPDVHNPNYDIPEGEVDVFAVAMNRRRRLERVDSRVPVGEVSSSLTPLEPEKSQEVHYEASNTGLRGRILEKIVPGKGWEVFDEPQGTCDGEYLSICGRSTDNPCILEGKHDARGVVIGSELSGWLVMDLKSVEEGIIVIKLHTWHFENENPRTDGWKGVNNEGEEAKDEKEENDKEEEKEEKKSEEKKEKMKAEDKEKETDNKEEEKEETDNKEEEEKENKDKGEEGEDSDKEEKKDTDKEKEEKKDDMDKGNEEKSEGENNEDANKDDANNGESANIEEAKDDSDTAERRLGTQQRRKLANAYTIATGEISMERDLMRNYETPELPDTFFFDYAINGKITSLNKKEFVEAKQQVQRVVETLTLLDDPEFTKGEEKNVEVAIRLRGCGRKCVFGLSHIYWA